MEARVAKNYLTKSEFELFVKSYHEFNQKNKSEFESKNEKVLELISKLDTFKINLSNIEK